MTLTEIFRYGLYTEELTKQGFAFLGAVLKSATALNCSHAVGAVLVELSSISNGAADSHPMDAGIKKIAAQWIHVVGKTNNSESLFVVRPALSAVLKRWQRRSMLGFASTELTQLCVASQQSMEDAASCTDTTTFVINILRTSKQMTEHFMEALSSVVVAPAAAPYAICIAEGLRDELATAKAAGNKNADDAIAKLAGILKKFEDPQDEDSAPMLDDAAQAQDSMDGLSPINVKQQQTPAADISCISVVNNEPASASPSMGEGAAADQTPANHGVAIARAPASTIKKGEDTHVDTPSAPTPAPEATEDVPKALEETPRAAVNVSHVSPIAPVEAVATPIVAEATPTAPAPMATATPQADSPADTTQGTPDTTMDANTTAVDPLLMSADKPTKPRLSKKERRQRNLAMSKISVKVTELKMTLEDLVSREEFLEAGQIKLEIETLESEKKQLAFAMLDTTANTTI